MSLLHPSAVSDGLPALSCLRSHFTSKCSVAAEGLKSLPRSPLHDVLSMAKRSAAAIIPKKGRMVPSKPSLPMDKELNKALRNAKTVEVDREDEKMAHVGEAITVDQPDVPHTVGPGTLAGILGAGMLGSGAIGGLTGAGVGAMTGYGAGRGALTGLGAGLGGIAGLPGMALGGAAGHMLTEPKKKKPVGEEKMAFSRELHPFRVSLFGGIRKVADMAPIGGLTWARPEPIQHNMWAPPPIQQRQTPVVSGQQVGPQTLASNMETSNASVPGTARGGQLNISADNSRSGANQSTPTQNDEYGGSGAQPTGTGQPM